MNRRDFFSSILGAPAAFAAVSAQASRPEGPLVMLECAGGHVPAPGYGDPRDSPLVLHNRPDGMRMLIPCGRCGVMFGIKR